jgi:hypothetical protein
MRMEAATPGPATLREARPIDLTRTAGTAGAAALIAEVLFCVRPYLQRTRSLGRAGLQTQERTVATIVAGVLVPAFRGRVVAAQRRPGGGMWRDGLIGHRRFWKAVSGLVAARLVAFRNGTKGAGIEWEPGVVSRAGRRFGGQPAKVWATRCLLMMAARHGVTPDSVRYDWPVSPAAEQARPKVPAQSLIQCHFNGKQVPLRPDQADEAERLRLEVQELNTTVANASIHGCRAPAFRRTFGPDLRLGGRFYAVGNGSFQQMSEAERERITIMAPP